MDANYPWQIDWSTEKVKKLIDLYRDYELLWNPKHPQYKNRVVRFTAWKDMAKKLRCQPIETEKKMNSLRVQFFREYQRITTSKKSSSNNVYQSTWPLFEFLKFLADTQPPLQPSNIPLVSY